MHRIVVTLTNPAVFAVLSFLAAAACGGGSGSPTAPGNGNPGGTPNPEVCRNYSSQETRVFASSNGLLSGTINQSCSYNTSSNELTCALNYSDSTGAAYAVTELARYASTADFVDEVRVVPPLSLARTGSTTYTPASLGLKNSTWTFSYDGQRRQTTRTFQFTDGSSQTVTHGAWDAAGRPTNATLSTPQPTTLLYSYNDAARTWTINTPSVGGVQTHTYNADGNLLSTVSSVGGMTTTYTVTIASTGRVCR